MVSAKGEKLNFWHLMYTFIPYYDHRPDMNGRRVTQPDIPRYSSDLLVPVDGRSESLGFPILPTYRVFIAHNSWNDLNGNSGSRDFKDFIMMRIGHESGHRSLNRKQNKYH